MPAFSPIRPLVVSLALLLPLAAHAAQEDLSSLSAAVVASDDPSWLNKSIDLDIKELPLDKALARILELVQVDAIPPVVSFKLPPQRLTLVMKSVNARDALAVVARLAGAQAFVTSDTQDGKRYTVVELRRRGLETSPGAKTAGGLPIFPGNDSRFFTFPNTFGFPGMGGAPSEETRERWALLPQKPVTVQASQLPGPELIRSVCKQIGVGCEIVGEPGASGVYSLNLTNSPAGAALDMVAQVVGCGWSVQKREGKTIVRFAPATESPRRNIDSGSVLLPATTACAQEQGSAAAEGDKARYANLPTRRVSLSVHKVSPRELAQKAAEKIGAAVRVTDIPESGIKLTVDAQDQAPGALLDLVAGLVGVGWDATKRGDKVTVTFARRSPVVQPTTRSGGPVSFSSEFSMSQSFSQQNSFSNGGTSFNGGGTSFNGGGTSFNGGGGFSGGNSGSFGGSSGSFGGSSGGSSSNGGGSSFGGSFGSSSGSAGGGTVNRVDPLTSVQNHPKAATLLPNKTVSVSANQLAPAELLTTLFEQAGVPVRVAAGVPKTPVSFRFSNVPFPFVLKLLCLQLGLECVPETRDDQLGVLVQPVKKAVSPL